MTFKFEHPSVDDLSIKHLSVSVNVNLIRLFSKEEVKQVACNRDNFKSLRSHGIDFEFIKEFWGDIKQDFMIFLSKFHRNGILAKGMNYTFVGLIPKVENPQRLGGFRPISVVGCLYKVLANVVVNRLRKVIGSIISKSQLAFVKGRQIFDEILIVNEIVDDAHKSKKELLMFKFDFEKAYDSMDWNYLEAVMRLMNFLTLWRKWIMECVTLATSMALVNESPTNEFL